MFFGGMKFGGLSKSFGDSMLGRPLRDPWDTDLARDQNHVPQEHVLRVGGCDLGQVQDYAALCVLEKRYCDEGFVGPPVPYVKVAKIRRYPNGTDYTVVAEDILQYPGLTHLVPEYNGVGRPVVDQLRKLAGQIKYRGRIIPIITAASNTRLHEVTDARGQSISVPKINLVSSVNMLMQWGDGGTNAKAWWLTTPREQRAESLWRIGIHPDDVDFDAPFEDEEVLGLKRSGLPREVQSVLRSKWSKLRVSGDRETQDNWRVLLNEMRDFQMRIKSHNSMQLGNVEAAGKHDDLVMAFSLGAFFLLNRCNSSPAVYMP